MITVSDTNSDRDIGVLTEDLTVSGTNADVQCAVPHDVSVSINVTGTNATVDIGGLGKASLQISGTNADVILGVKINANTVVTGTNVSVTTNPLPELTQRANSFNVTPTQGLKRAHSDDHTSIPSIEPDWTSSQQHDEKSDTLAEDTDTVVYEGSPDETGETRVYKGENSNLADCSHCGATLHKQNPKYCSQCGARL
jgi:hypothetical protein